VCVCAMAHGIAAGPRDSNCVFGVAWLHTCARVCAMTHAGKVVQSPRQCDAV